MDPEIAALWLIVHPMFREALRAQIAAEIAAHDEREKSRAMVEAMRRDIATAAGLVD